MRKFLLIAALSIVTVLVGCGNEEASTPPTTTPSPVETTTPTPTPTPEPINLYEVFTTAIVEFNNLLEEAGFSVNRTFFGGADLVSLNSIGGVSFAINDEIPLFFFTLDDEEILSEIQDMERIHVYADGVRTEQSFPVIVNPHINSVLTDFVADAQVFEMFLSLRP